MSQHDFNIANATFPATRTDLNNALAALASTSLGTTAPSTTFAGQLWYDSTNEALKIRNEADDAWITLFSINQATASIQVGDNDSAPPQSHIKEIFNTVTLSTSSASGKALTLSESIANFDYLEFIASEEINNGYVIYTDKIRVSEIPSSSRNRFMLYSSFGGSNYIEVWGSGTSLKIREHGAQVISIRQILGVKLLA